MSGRREFPRGKLQLDTKKLSALIPDRQAYEQALGTAVFAGDAVGDAYQETAAWVRSNNNRLHIRLRLDSPELHELHWERLYVPQDGSWNPLASSPLAFTRYIPTSTALWEQVNPVTDRPLRVLAIVASPPELEEYRLPTIAHEEIHSLHTILDGLPNLDVTYLETGTGRPPTLNQIQKALTEGCHIIHFLGHGRWAKSSENLVLFLEDDQGQCIPVHDRLASMFTYLQTPPLLCFLAAPERLASDVTEDSARIGRALVESGGVRAAIAMTNHSGMKTAQAFVGRFYQRLLTHGIVDLAVNEASAAIPGEQTSDWEETILFSRVSDNQLIGF